MKLKYEVIYALSRRARYKFISEDKNYCYFVFQGVRVEAIKDESGYYIVCCCKGGASKITNKANTFGDRILYIADDNLEMVYDKDIYNSFINSILSYIEAHKNWF